MTLGVLFEGIDKGMLSLLMMLSAIAIMLMLMRRQQFRSATRRDVSREQLARLRDQRNLQQSMDELLIQIEEVSRRVSAQVDTKFAKLEQVICDADERIARLENLLGRRGDEAPSAAPAKPKFRLEQISDKSNPSLPPMTDMASSGEADAGSKIVAEEVIVPPLNPDPRFKQIYELVDSGHTPIQAAEALAMPLGEVELILNLRKYR